MTTHTYGGSTTDLLTSRVLTFAVIIGSVLLLVAAMAGPLPGTTQAAAQNAPVVEHVAQATTAHNS